MLHVREDLRDGFRPLVLSNNAEKPRPGRSQFLTESDYLGTQDCTAYYAIPKAIEFMGSLASGWPEVQGHNRDLCLRGREIISAALGIDHAAPSGMIGSIATMILPSHGPERDARLMQRPTRYHDALQDALLSKWKIQVPVWGLPGKQGDTRRFVRISAQLYNSAEQYEYLARALKAELAAEVSALA
jgi:isopenicillin-N epimerase